jgi:hypothetical protein
MKRFLNLVVAVAFFAGCFHNSAAMAQSEDLAFGEIFKRLSSDSLAEKRDASRELERIFDLHSLDSWETLNVQEFEAEGMRCIEEIYDLAESSDFRTARVCLEVIGRLGESEQRKGVQLAGRLMNDFFGSSPRLRQQAFRTHCLLSSSDLCVFENLDDVGLTFDLYNIAAIINSSGEKENAGVAFKYAGLIQTVEHLFETTLLKTGHGKSELKFLGNHLDSSKPKIVRIFCCLLLSAHGSNAASELEKIDAGILDRDEEIRFFCASAKLNIVKSREDIENVVASANLTLANARYLQQAYGNSKE